MRLPKEIFRVKIANQKILMELTDTKTQMQLLKKLISVYEKRGIIRGAKDLINILKGSFSFIFPFGKGQLLYCDFYNQNTIFKANKICSEKCRGKLIYIEGKKYIILNIFHPLKKDWEPEKIYEEVLWR